MNKLIYVFVGVFVVLIGLLIVSEDSISAPSITETVQMEENLGSSVQSEAPPEETTIPETTVPETTIPETEPPEEPALFVAVYDGNPPNQEMQTYLPQQVTIDGKHIAITAERIGGSWREFLSGKAESVEAVRYGTFAFELNTMRGKGLFPAIWMLPTDGNPLPEVDIYELVGDKPHEFYGVRHYLDETWEREDHLYYHFPPNNIPETYAIKLEWTPEKLTWYLNDEEIYSIEEAVPDMPMYVIINLAVGGVWPGMPNVNTEFPATFHVEVLEFEPMEVFPRQ